MTSPIARINPPLIAERNDEVKKLSVGIVGAGLMGKWHANAAKRAGGVIIAIADVDQKQSKNLAVKYSSAQCFENVEAMLLEKSLDVVHICTPTSTHRHLIEQFVKAKVNVFVEKPLSQSAPDTVYLYALTKQYEVKICPVHQFAFQKGTQKAITQLKSIGNLIHLEATICSAGGMNSPVEVLDSIAFDILPHPLSLFQLFLQRELPLENWRIQHSRSGEILISGCSGDILLEISISLNARPTMNTFQMRGTDGTINLDLFHGFSYFEDGTVSRLKKILRPFTLSIKIFSAAALGLLQRTIKREMAYPGLQQLIDSFYKSIRSNGETPITDVQAINVALVRDILMKEVANITFNNVTND